MNVGHSQTRIEILHTAVGQLTRQGIRLLATVMTLGTLFCMMLTFMMQLTKTPEQTLYLKAFMFNYQEFSRVATELPPKARAPMIASAKNGSWDPNWDGVMAGGSLGFVLGQNVPFIGSVAGPLMGMVIGYEIDSRI